MPVAARIDSEAPPLSVDPRNSEQSGNVPTPTDDAVLEATGGRGRLVEIRCAFAESARKEAEAASARVMEAKRLLDEQSAAVAEAQAAIDPSATHAIKDDAHRAFRAEVAAARTRSHVEAAAIAWLNKINEINGQGRALQARVKHERELADALVSQLAKLSSTAEASATMAARAIEACRAARAALEAGDAMEAAETAEVSASPAAPAPVASGVEPPTSTAEAAPASASDTRAPATPTESPPDEASVSSDWLVIDLRSVHPQAVVRLMRRDGHALNTLVDRLAGSDPAARSRWGFLLSNFVDSVVAAAIEDACLEFPPGNQFWDQFSAPQSREIARGLAALGYRYDGFGAFAEGRVPTHRDLAMAVDSAGLLPVRVRHWPTPEESAQLFGGVRASGDTFIAGRAPALTLGELVRLLGRRAEPLADLWNEWPQVRPLLFSTDL